MTKRNWGPNIDQKQFQNTVPSWNPSNVYTSSMTFKNSSHFSTKNQFHERHCRLWRVQTRISKGFDVFEYYANNQWDFNNDISLTARKYMNPKERHLYKVDGDGIDYLTYFTDCTHAARLYVLKEPDDTLPAARRHMKMWVSLGRKKNKMLRTCNLCYSLFFLQNVLGWLLHQSILLFIVHLFNLQISIDARF